MKLLRIAAAALLVTLLSACAAGSNFDRLPQLQAAHAPELRVEIVDYPSVARTAYVVTPGQVAIYEYRGRRWQSEVVQTAVADDVLVAAFDLQPLDGANLGCDLIDGSSVSIEASIGAERFALTAANPELCGLAREDQALARVNHVLHLITALGEEPIPAPSP